MDDLLIRYLAGEVTEAESVQVNNWRGESPANELHYNQLLRIWDGSAELRPALPSDEDQAWQRLQLKLHPQPAVTAAKPSSFNWRVAAGIILVLTAALSFYFLVLREPASPKLMAVITANEVKADTLPDGSVATLNKHSSLSYPKKFRGNTRDVKLEGEAFFNITPDKERPFIINVNDVQVKVVGTSFNVRNEKGKTEIIVETGIVQVIRNGQLLELKAGERTVIGNDSIAAKTSSGDKLYNYYVSRTFICDNTPLWKLVDKLNEAYDANIVIGTARLRKLPLNVTFNEESLEVILNIISQTLLVKVSREDNQIIIH